MVSGVSVQVPGDSKRDNWAAKLGGPKAWKFVSVRALKLFSLQPHTISYQL
jgi:hypothetical protein